MSNRSRSSSKRASMASKQHGLLESFKRGEKKTAVVDEEEPTVIDLDDDDPYKFVDSQSLLPDSDGWSGALDDDDDFITLSSSKLTSAPTTRRKAEDSHSSTGGVATPKRSRTLGGATGSAKRKQTPKSKKSSVQQEEWSEEEMKRAIEASIQEKQREDRRQRQKLRESKVEEEQQLLLAQYQSMAAAEKEEEGEDWWEEGDDGAGRGEAREEATSGDQPITDLYAPSDQEPSAKRKPTLTSPMPVAGLASSSALQLKSVSIKKLSMKSLQVRKGRRTNDTLEEEGEGEVQVITLQEEGETSDEVMKINRSSTLIQNGTASSNSMPVTEIPKGLKRFCVEYETIPADDFDATPPISEQEKEIKCGVADKAQTAISKPLSRPALSEKQLVSDKQGEGGKTKSSKTGLSLKKGRKRLSDSGSSSFQKMPNSSSEQGPASKRPRMEVSDMSGSSEPNATKSSEMTAAARPELITNAKLPTDMEVEHEVNQASPTEPSIATAGSREPLDSGDTDRVTKKTGVKPAVISLTGTEQTEEVVTKGVDFTTNQKQVNELHEKSDKKETLTTMCSSATVSAMEGAAALPSAVRLQHEVLPNAERTTKVASATVSEDRDTKNIEFQLIRRVKAVGWPPVKFQPLEVPRNPSLRAPPGILPAEHTKVLIQCFNAYFAKLAAAQCKVLRRIKWGSPVSSFNKVGVNSLTSGRRTRRSRASNTPYSEYALDLKIMAPSSRSKSSSPMVSSKRSTPSKSPVSNIGQQFSPSDENDSDCDFEPSKVTGKRSSRKKSNANAGAGKTTMTTPTTKSQRAMKSLLSLGKRSPQLQEKSISPGVQVEREESPDILPPATRTHRPGGEPEKKLSTKPSGRRLEFGVAAEKPTHSVPPVPPTISTSQPPRNISPQFQEDSDNVMMLDLTSPSPPLLSAQPQERRTIDRDGTKGDDFNTSFSDVDEENLVREKPASSHVHVGHDIMDDSDEEHHPQEAATSADAATGAKNSSGSWLDSRKPPPSAQKPKPKRQPAKRTNTSKASTVQGKKKAGGGGGGARGRKSTKKTTSATLRIKALIQKSDFESESEHGSLEESEGDSSSKETTSKKPPKSKTKRHRTIDSTDDSEVTDMELEEREGEMASPGLLMSQTGLVERGKEVTRSNQDSHNLESVIDLTAESQVPRDHTSSPSPCQWIPSPTDDSCLPCPMCNKRFDSSVIQLHAEQCEGPESDDDDRQWSESITRYTTTTTKTASVSKPGAGAGGRKGSLSMGKRQLQQEPRGRGRGRRGEGRRKKSYQPSLMQLVNKEREVIGEEDIDSGTTTEDDPLDPDVNLDDLLTSDRRGTDPTTSYYTDTNLEWTEREEQQSTSTAVSASGGAYGGGEGAFGQQPEVGEGGFIVELSPTSTPQPEAVAIEDGEGGYIIDPSMISSSPIRCFKKLGDMDPQERAWYEDQYKGKSGRGGGQGRKSQRGGGRRQLLMTSKDRELATWGRDDFGDLFKTDERSKGQGRRGRGRGSNGGRKYDWNRARNRGRGRGRAGSRSRGRCS